MMALMEARFGAAWLDECRPENPDWKIKQARVAHWLAFNAELWKLVKHTPWLLNAFLQPALLFLKEHPAEAAQAQMEELQNRPN